MRYVFRKICSLPPLHSNAFVVLVSYLLVVVLASKRQYHPSKRTGVNRIIRIIRTIMRRGRSEEEEEDFCE